MKVTKYGHCCLLIETKGKRILTDPGSFTTEQDSLTGIDIVLITHEHADHCHSASIKMIMTNNPGAVIVTNSSVGRLLLGQEIPCTILEGTAMGEVSDITLEACDGKHEEIFEDFGQVPNTGYLINGEIYLPGDSFHVPAFKVKTLALPVGGPWCRIPDALRFAIAIKPTSSFPIHDANIRIESAGFMYTLIERILSQHGIAFTQQHAGDTVDYEV